MKTDEFKQIQQQLGWTNEFLSRQLDVSLNTLNAWRSGKNRIIGTTSLVMRLLLWLKINNVKTPIIQLEKEDE